MKYQNGYNSEYQKRGFTLVEIMIVVVIIMLLAAMALPAFQRSRMNAQNSRVVNDIRIFQGAFQQYALEYGDFPADVGPRTVPPGVGQYFHAKNFLERTAVGGFYDWDYGVFGVTAAVSVDGTTCSSDQLLMIDEDVDDGNPTSGNVRISGTRIMFILED